jgi:chromosome segregation ATPase
VIVTALEADLKPQLTEAHEQQKAVEELRELVQRLQNEEEGRAQRHQELLAEDATLAEQLEKRKIAYLELHETLKTAQSALSTAETERASALSHQSAVETAQKAAEEALNAATAEYATAKDAILQSIDAARQALSDSEAEEKRVQKETDEMMLETVGVKARHVAAQAHLEKLRVDSGKSPSPFYIDNPEDPLRLSYPLSTLT